MMYSRLTASAAITLVGLSIGCASLGANRHQSHKVFLTPDDRLAAVQRARLWTPTHVAAMDMRTGPRGRGAFAPGQTVSCDYVDEKLGGTSAKFACAITRDDVVKVRYGRTNGEVYAGVAATRLLWALGFGADPLYPVHVVCRGCPASLREEGQTAAGDLHFDIAAIERKMRGREMETYDGSGWSWPELDHVDSRVGGAAQSQRDALKLLAVLLQHTDNKAEQQRLLCLDAKTPTRELAHCKMPFMLIHDVGQTFGTANLFNRTSVGSVNLTAWARAPIWKDVKRCMGNLSASQTGSLIDPTISEAGRHFLADLLMALTDGQLHDLFDVARFVMRPDADGRATTNIAGWVNEFRKKRQDIVSAHCPS